MRDPPEGPYWELQKEDPDDPLPELGMDIDETTAELESIVFGRKVVKDAEGEVQDSKGKKGKDKKAKDAASEDAEAGEDDWDEDYEEEAKQRYIPTEAWVDKDDLKYKVDLRGEAGLRQLWNKNGRGNPKITGKEMMDRNREEFRKIYGEKPLWAQSAGANNDKEDASEESGDEAEPAVASSKPLGERSGGALAPTEIHIKKLKEVNIVPGEWKGPAAVKALQFHPGSSLLLVGGMDKTLRLFAADGDENPKVASYHFKNFPILGASFLPGGDKILMTSEDATMWGLDVATGEPLHIRNFGGQQPNRYFGLTVGPEPSDEPGLKTSKMYAVLGDLGTIQIGDAVTQLPIRTLRMAVPGVAAAFAPGRDALITADAENNLYEWDLGTGRCKWRRKETWATGITCLATSGITPRSARQLLAVGTVSGNIDMYDISGETLPREPFKTIKNLTTSVTGIRFHRSGELAVGYSDEKKDAIKLLHTPSMTVFKNWPLPNGPIARVSQVALARTGGIMAVGNDKGRVLLYSLRHYEAGDGAV